MAAEDGEGGKSSSDSDRLSKWLQILTLIVGGGVGGFAGVVLSNIIEWRKLDEASQAANLSFVEKYLEDVIKLDINSRIRIAEYFGQIIEDEGHKKRWNHYLAVLKKNQSDWMDEYVTLLSKDSSALTVREGLRLQEIQGYFGEAKNLQIGLPKGLPQPPEVASDAGKLLSACAKGQIGVTEDPNRTNRGARIDEYISAMGGNPENAEPWGAAFVGWCLKATGLSQWLPGSATASDLWAVAQAKGFAVSTADLKPSDLRLGDVYVMSGGEGASEVGIVTDVTDAPMLFWGIQGDTTPKGGEGFGVFERRLPVRMINIGVIRLASPAVAPQAAGQ